MLLDASAEPVAKGSVPADDNHRFPSRLNRGTGLDALRSLYQAAWQPFQAAAPTGVDAQLNCRLFGTHRSQERAAQ